MKRPLIATTILSLVIVSGCARSPYKILDRKDQGPGGLIVVVRAEVPTSATKAQMEGWCADINKSEGDGKSVMVEFLEEGAGVRQKGVCAGGTVLEGASMPGINVTVK